MNFTFNMLRPVECKMKLFGFCARSLRTAWRDLELLRRLCFVNTHLNSPDQQICHFYRGAQTCSWSVNQVHWLGAPGCYLPSGTCGADRERRNKSCSQFLSRYISSPTSKQHWTEPSGLLLIYDPLIWAVITPVSILRIGPQFIVQCCVATLTIKILILERYSQCASWRFCLKNVGDVTLAVFLFCMQIWIQWGVWTF